MGQYYDLIMEPTQGSFTNHFNKCWKSQLDLMMPPYADAIQLRIGNQLRPKLTCWGAAFNTNTTSEIDLVKVAEIAAYVEMLHKASIIIDDMVDDDDARHERPAFHIEFGRNKAIIFALALLGRGTSGINSIFKTSSCHFQSVDLYSNTICKMAQGCLEELSLTSSGRYNIEGIRKIINLETITLIKNSFLLGYWSNSYQNELTEKIIVEIGDNCGYIFQILNDLEPFSSAERNKEHKGNRNIDVDRNRKNIAVAYIYGSASEKEKQLLRDTVGGDLHAHMLELYSKYAVYDEICAEARALESKCINLIEQLRQSEVHIGSLKDFKVFVNEMVSICFSNLK